MQVQYCTRGGKTLDKLFDLVYPVGSVYMSISATSPQTLFGGQWTKIEGRFLWATGSTPGTTGGSRTTDSTVLTIDQIPSHSHPIPNTNSVGYNMGTLSNFGNKGWVATPPAAYTGGVGKGKGHTHTFMPPYFEVYMWYRTA